MEIKFKLNIEDYLEYNLYTLAKSKNFSKQINRNRFTGSLAYFIVGFFVVATLSSQLFVLNFFVLVFFIVMGAIHYFNAPSKFKVANEKLNLNILDETYDSIYFSTKSFSTDDFFIYIKDDEFEIKINIREVKEIIELHRVIAIVSKSGKSTLVSKRDINNLELLKNSLSLITDKFTIPFIKKDNWRWQ